MTTLAAHPITPTEWHTRVPWHAKAKITAALTREARNAAREANRARRQAKALADELARLQEHLPSEAVRAAAILASLPPEPYAEARARLWVATEQAWEHR